MDGLKKFISFVFSWIMPVGLLIFTVCVSIYNYNNNVNFLDISVGTSLTLLIAISVAYLATQKKTDDREAKKSIEQDKRDAKKHIELIIEKIQSIVQSEQFYCIQNPGDHTNSRKIRENLQMANKKMKNLIYILEKYGERFDFVEEAKYINSNFSEYRGFVDDLLMDLEALSKANRALHNYAINIDNKCDEIIFKLHGL